MQFRGPLSEIIEITDIDIISIHAVKKTTFDRNVKICIKTPDKEVTIITNKKYKQNGMTIIMSMSEQQKFFIRDSVLKYVSGKNTEPIIYSLVKAQ